MPAFLVTGNPGSGKSELARELTRRGVLAIDPDDDPGLAHWLRIDGPTQEARLAAYDAQHPPGRSEAGRNEIREGRTVFETQVLRAGAIALDGTAPTAMVADELISLAD